MEGFVNNKETLYRVKFIVYLILQITAILITITVFIFFSKHPTLLRSSQNHGLLLLLTINLIQLLINMPMVLHFYDWGFVNPPTSVHCVWWTYFEYNIYAINGYLLGTIGIQRHLFAFHSKLLRTLSMRIWLHYLPLAFCVVYPSIFYIFAIVTYPCDSNPWDYTKKLCGYGNCYLVYDKFLGTFDLFVNNSLPVIIDIIANILLICRVYVHKNRVGQSVRRRQQRRMMIQLACLSSLYLVCWTPFLVVIFVNVLVDPSFMNEIQIDYFSDMLYMVHLLLPCMCLIFFPELRRWIAYWYPHRQNRNTIVPLQSDIDGGRTV